MSGSMLKRGRVLYSLQHDVQRPNNIVACKCERSFALIKDDCEK